MSTEQQQQQQHGMDNAIVATLTLCKHHGCADGLLLQVQAGAEALCAFRVDANDCSKPAPAPLIGTLGKTGGHGSEVNVAHRLWSSTNRHQASWAYISKEVIQGWFEDYAEKL